MELAVKVDLVLLLLLIKLHHSFFFDLLYIMTFPITIVDNFFEDPDSIVEMAESMAMFPPSSGN